MGFFRQECKSRLPFPSPGDLPNPGIEPRSPALQTDALPSEPPGKPTHHLSKALSNTITSSIRTSTDEFSGDTNIQFATEQKLRSPCEEGDCRLRTSLVVQWLRCCASKAGGPGSIPGQGTRSHVPQLRPSAAK